MGGLEAFFERIVVDETTLLCDLFNFREMLHGFEGQLLHFFGFEVSNQMKVVPITLSTRQSQSSHVGALPLDRRRGASRSVPNNPTGSNVVRYIIRSIEVRLAM